MIIPSMFSSFRFFSQTSAIFFQSEESISSENFIKGFSIFTMLQIFFISGAIFKISSASVEITAPDFGSSLEEIVPPVIIITTFLNFLSLIGKEAFLHLSHIFFPGCFAFSRTLASMISLSRIPMLYPLDNFNRIISGSCD